jgi:hypothetical protein
MDPHVPTNTICCTVNTTTLFRWLLSVDGTFKRENKYLTAADGLAGVDDPRERENKRESKRENKYLVMR